VLRNIVRANARFVRSHVLQLLKLQDGHASVRAQPRPRSRRPSSPRTCYLQAMRILPDDPLVRWLIYLCLVVSIGAPLVAALVLALTQ
jgi:hypothetical protein